MLLKTITHQASALPGAACGPSRVLVTPPLVRRVLLSFMEIGGHVIYLIRKVLRTWVEPQLGCAAGVHLAGPGRPGSTFPVGACCSKSERGIERGTEGEVDVLPPENDLVTFQPMWNFCSPAARIPSGGRGIQDP